MEPLADNGLIWEFIPPFLNIFFFHDNYGFFTMYEMNEAGKMQQWNRSGPRNKNWFFYVYVPIYLQC